MEAYSLLLFCLPRKARGDTSLARNEAGGIRFSSVRAARAENDIQNYFRSNDPFPTDSPSFLPFFPSLSFSLNGNNYGLFIVRVIQEAESNLSKAMSLCEKAFKKREKNEKNELLIPPRETAYVCRMKYNIKKI